MGAVAISWGPQRVSSLLVDFCLDNARRIRSISILRNWIVFLTHSEGLNLWSVEYCIWGFRRRRAAMPKCGRCLGVALRRLMLFMPRRTACEKVSFHNACIFRSTQCHPPARIMMSSKGDSVSLAMVTEPNNHSWKSNFYDKFPDDVDWVWTSC